jgi:heme-degrading monooxygenase HmoA
MTHAEQQPVTMINVFTVEPDDQQALVDLLVQATDHVMSKQAGYLSGRIHRSLDGRRVAVYARWRSVEDFAALKDTADAVAHMTRARALATFEPVLYDLVLTHDTGGAADEMLAGERGPSRTVVRAMSFTAPRCPNMGSGADKENRDDPRAEEDG